MVPVPVQWGCMFRAVRPGAAAVVRGECVPGRARREDAGLGAAAVAAVAVAGWARDLTAITAAPRLAPPRPARGVIPFACLPACVKTSYNDVKLASICILPPADKFPA